MVDPVQLRVVEPTVDPSVIEALDELMTLAADGDIVGVAAVFVRADGSIDTSWSASADLLALLAGAARLAHQINETLNEAD